jgi:Na+-transporting methylmalonyl-CoA/oxaloacetate decarboxylase gamma subunit
MMLGEIKLDPLFDETGIPLAIMGMLVVFVALGILLGVVSALPRLIALFEPKPEPKSEPSKAKESGDVADVSQGSENQDAEQSPTPVPIPPAMGVAAAAVSDQDAAASNSAKDADASGLTPELIAVLTAAAEYELGTVRIVRMRPLTPSELAWTLEGRLRHHASHRLQPRNR